MNTLMTARETDGFFKQVIKQLRAVNKDTKTNGFDANQSPETCKELVIETIDALKARYESGRIFGKSIAVLYTVEFAVELHKLNHKNVTVLTKDLCKVTKYIANKLGFKYNTINEALNTKMKFDIILGNPPYKKANEGGGVHSLWRKIIVDAFSLLNKDGYISMICPAFPINSRDLGPHLRNNTPVSLDNDISHHFPGIGSEFKAWTVKQGIHDDDFIVDGNVWEGEGDPSLNPLYASIVKKLEGTDLFECKYDPGYNSTQLKNDNNDYFEVPTGNSVYPIRHGSKVKVAYVSKPTQSHYQSKVMLTFSGYPDFTYSDKNNPMSSCSQMSGYIPVRDSKEADSLIKLYTTKLYTFLSTYTFRGMKGTVSYTLPKMNLNQTWTDQDLYEHFNLTQEEIDFVEENQS